MNYILKINFQKYVKKVLFVVMKTLTRNEDDLEWKTSLHEEWTNNTLNKYKFNKFISKRLDTGYIYFILECNTRIDRSSMKSGLV